MQAMPLVEMWHGPPALIEDQELVGAARRSAQLAEPGNRDEFPLTPLLQLHDSPNCNGSTPVLIIGFLLSLPGGLAVRPLDLHLVRQEAQQICLATPTRALANKHLLSESARTASTPMSRLHERSRCSAPI